ncbi:MAG TPA: hypothetical protein VFE37_14855 [Chloroflexota bacterium]|nr:hypothetical protein [Chloroflexota bacterium]
MPRLTLSFISSLHERTQPLFDGSVQPEGITLLTTRSPASETFWRQLKYAEFAVAEMSLSSYLIARERGSDMIAIPVFPTRWFMWAELYYRIAEGARFQAAHGFIPASHTYVIRGDVYREHPWVALNLYKAFVQAKELAHGRLEASLPAALIFGREYWAQTRRLFGDDPYPYGFRANQPMLRTLLDFSHEQGLMHEKPALADLFAPSTLEL